VIVLRVISWSGLAHEKPSYDPVGLYVVDCDFDAGNVFHPGSVTLGDVSAAKRFATLAEAGEYRNRPSVHQPRPRDGGVNRPLSALSLEFEFVVDEADEDVTM
jgi:hypothetical protein